MVKKAYIRAIPVVMVCVFTLFSGISHAGIDGSGHDLTWSAGSPAVFQFITNRKCVFCHTPHGANTTVTAGRIYNDTTQAYEDTSGWGTNPVLLWNRDLANISSSSYSLYNSSTMNYESGQIRIYSLLCMSCHDGVSALNVVTHLPGDVVQGNPSLTYIPPQPSGPTYIGEIFDSGSGSGWQANIGERTDNVAFDEVVNLSNDHPVSINYPTSGDSGLEALATVRSSGLEFYPIPGTGEKRSLECSTCHNVHEPGNSSSGTVPFLRVSNANSGLCTTCHLK